MAKPLVLPPLRRTESDAREFARTVHWGQTDKAGAPYFWHLSRVRTKVMAKALHLPCIQTDEALQMAWLHDVLEDTEYTAEDLLREGFSPNVVSAVDMLLTNRGTAPYLEWIEWLTRRADLPVLLVKIADVEDNSDPERLALLPDAVRAWLERKYAPALVVLREAAERLGWKAPNPQI